MLIFLFVFCYYIFIYLFLNRISLHNPGWPRNCRVDQPGLVLAEIPDTPLPLSLLLSLSHINNYNNKEKEAGSLVLA